MVKKEKIRGLNSSDKLLTEEFGQLWSPESARLKKC